MSGKISVIIPTIEEEAVFGIIKELRSKFGNRIELIIVDKSSEQYHSRLKKTGARVLRQRDKGVENAIMLGLRSAGGDILASIDADGTHELGGIERAVKLVAHGDADLVLGNRFGKLEKGAMSPHLVIGNKAISKVYSQMYNATIHDVLTGLFVMNRRAFNSIRNIAPYRAGIAFFAIELAKRGYTVTEIPISYSPRSSGESKLAKSKVVYGMQVTSHIVRFARDYNPLLVFGGLGVILLIVGFALGGFVVISFLTSGSFTEIGRSLIAFMLVTVGILSIIAGFIIDLLLEVAKKLE